MKEHLMNILFTAVKNIGQCKKLWSS